MAQQKRQKKQKHEGKQNFIILTVILGILLIITLIINIALTFAKPVYEKEVVVAFSVGENPGITTNTDILDFGRLMPGSSVGRLMFLENQYAFPIEINIFISPELDGFIYGKKSVVLDPGQKIEYGIALKVPKNSEFMNVTGIIRFEGYKMS